MQKKNDRSHTTVSSHQKFNIFSKIFEIDSKSCYFYDSLVMMPEVWRKKSLHVFYITFFVSRKRKKKKAAIRPSANPFLTATLSEGKMKSHFVIVFE